MFLISIWSHFIFLISEHFDNEVHNEVKLITIELKDKSVQTIIFMNYNQIPITEYIRYITIITEYSNKFI